MTKEEIRQLLPLYIEGELEAPVMEEIKAALLADPELQNHADALKQSWEMLDEWADVEPKANYISRFWTRLASEKSWLEKLTSGFEVKRFVPTLVTACAVAVLTVTVLNYNQPLPSSDQVLTQMSEEDMELVENLELIEDIEFLEEIEFIDEYGMAGFLRHA